MAKTYYFFFHVSVFARYTLYLKYLFTAPAGSLNKATTSFMPILQRLSLILRITLHYFHLAGGEAEDALRLNNKLKVTQ